MVDLSQAIYDALAAEGTGLSSLVGTRIYEGHAPRSGTNKFTNSEAIIVYALVPGGASHVSGAIHRVIVEFKCYGGTADITQAKEVYRALWNRLQLYYETINERTIEGAREISTGRPLTEPDPEYPVYVGQFELLIKE